MEKNKFLDDLKAKVDLGEATEVERVRVLPGTKGCMLRLQKKYPQLRGMKDILLGLDSFGDNSLIFEGSIRQGNKEYPFVNFVKKRGNLTDVSCGRNFIFMPGNGMQLYNKGKYNGEKQDSVTTYLKEDSKTRLFTKSSDDIGNRLVDISETIKNESGKKETKTKIGKYLAPRLFDNASDSVLNGVEEKYPNRIVKTTGYVQYDGDKNEIARVEYGFLYESSTRGLPIRIYTWINGIRTVYELGREGKYTVSLEEPVKIHVLENGVTTVFYERKKYTRGKGELTDSSIESDSRKDQTGISLTEFEKSMQEKYGIEPIRESKCNQLFMNQKAYCVPDVIIKIVESCRDLIKEQERANRGENK